MPRYQTQLSVAFLFTIGSLLPLTHAQANPTTLLVPVNDPHLRLLGRIDDRDPAHPRLAYPGTGVEFRLMGTSAELHVNSDSATSVLTIVVDHGAPALRVLAAGDNSVSIPMPIDNGPHTVQIYKRTETWQGVLTLNGLALPPGTLLLDPPSIAARRLMFVGDSVTCGVGIDNNAQCAHDPELPDINPYESYGMLLGRRLDADTQLICYGGRGLVRDYRGLTIADNVVNIPQFISLAVASDKPEGRVPWDPARFQPDAIFISLGTNDMNLEKTKPLDPDKWVAQYVAFLHAVRRDYPRALIFVTEGAIVTNPLLAQLVQRAAGDSLDSRVLYTPSHHYPGNRCNGHPTRIQHQHMADDFEPVLRHDLGW